MREWIPISTSPKGRLTLAAVTEFGSRPFDRVTVGELAAAAGVTTGAIYHHFGSKVGLYTVVRTEVEQRLIDRMEGAAAAAGNADPPAAVASAMQIGFDFAVREGFLHILSAPPLADHDRVAHMLTLCAGGTSEVLGRVLAAAWRAAVSAVADGVPAEEARAALLRVTLQPAN